MTLKILNRFLFSLFIILGISQISKSDTSLPLIGTRIVVYKGPWNNLTPANGLRHYTIKNVPKSYQLALQFTNFDAGTASVTLSNLYCSLDPTVNDFDSASNLGKFTNISFSSGGANVTSSIISLIGGGVFASGYTVTTPTLPCTSITIELSNATQIGTNIEVVAIFSDIVLGQTNSGGAIANSGTGMQVQGLVPSGQNGFPSNPLVDGGLLPASNAQTFSLGVDSQGNNGVGTATPSSPTVGLIPPVPNKSGQFTLAFMGNSHEGTVTSDVQTPWVCATGANTCDNSSVPTVADKVLSLGSQNILAKTFTNIAANDTFFAQFVLFSNVPTIRQITQNNSATSITSVSNTLAGSVTIFAVVCSTTACNIAPTDGQGIAWKNISTISIPNGNAVKGMTVWIGGPNTAAADTITYNVVSGTPVGAALLELTGVTVASLNQPVIGFQTDPAGRETVAVDAIGANTFTLSATLSTNTTTQIVPAPATGSCGPPTTTCRAYVTDIQINTTAAGTATTIQLKDGTGANCITGTANLSAIAYPNTTIAITNILGVHTPLGAPASTAVCATQAGTTAGTSVVELRGFFAP